MVIAKEAEDMKIPTVLPGQGAMILLPGLRETAIPGLSIIPEVAGPLLEATTEQEAIPPLEVSTGVIVAVPPEVSIGAVAAVPAVLEVSIGAVLPGVQVEAAGVAVLSKEETTIKLND